MAFNKCSKAAMTCWNHLFLLCNFFIWVDKEDMEALGAKLGPSRFPLYHIAKREWRTYYIISPIWKLISGKFADRQVFFPPPFNCAPPLHPKFEQLQRDFPSLSSGPFAPNLMVSSSSCYQFLRMMFMMYGHNHFSFDCGKRFVV